MRRHFAYLALTALLLTATFTGCRQEPLPATGDAIRFSVVSPTLSVDTKAELVEGTKIQDSTIVLFSSKQSAGAAAKTAFFGADGTSSSTTLQYTEEAWRYDPVKYWERDATYDFRAVCPSSADVTAGSNSDEIVVSDFSIGSSYDLMVASQTGVTSAAQAGTAVPLEFKHACAAVRFLFKDGTNDYHIKSFTLSGITTSGTMTYSGADDALPTWGDLGATAYSWAGTPWEVPEEYDETGLEGWYFVVPQNLGDGAKLSFTYTVGSDGTQDIPVTIPLKGGVGVNTSSVFAWDRAKAYTYKIQIQANAIEFDVAWTSWVEGNTYYFLEE